MSKVEIYYFSGTGNSLHVARELQKRIPEANLIPMLSLLNQDVIEIKGETVGLVFPVYLTTVPAPVRTFLQKLEPKSAKYLFAVATRERTLCLAHIFIRRILKEKGKDLDADFILNMAGNSPTGLKPGPGSKDWVNQISKEKIVKLESEIQPRLDAIQQAILTHEKYSEKDSRRPLYHFLERTFSRLTANPNAEIPYYTDLTCSGCGTCEKVCLSQKIKVTNGKPVWQKNVKCYYCYACFNFCPTQSILVAKKYTDKNGRYFHPEVTVNDIAGQKCR